MNLSRIRAWDDEEQRMIPPSSVPFEIGYNLQEFCEVFLAGLSERYTPMLSTEFTDKNKIEVFDGDILKFEKKPSKNYKGSERISYYYEVFFSERGQWAMRGLNINCTQRLAGKLNTHKVVGSRFDEKIMSQINKLNESDDSQNPK